MTAIYDVIEKNGSDASGTVAIDPRDLAEINAHFGTKAVDFATAGHCGDEYSFFDRNGACVLVIGINTKLTRAAGL